MNILINYCLTIFLCSVIDTFLEDNHESNDSDNGSIYSANISLENYESNDSDDESDDSDDESNDSNNESNDSANISLEDHDSDDDSIYSADISLENYSLNEDDTNRSIDFGKNFNYLYIIQFLQN